MRSSSLLTTNPARIVLGRFLCLLGLHWWYHRGRLRTTRFSDVGTVARCWRDCLAVRPVVVRDEPLRRPR